MTNGFDEQTLREQVEAILDYLLDSPDQTIIPDGRVGLLQRTLRLCRAQNCTLPVGHEGGHLCNTTLGLWEIRHHRILKGDYWQVWKRGRPDEDFDGTEAECIAVRDALNPLKGEV